MKIRDKVSEREKKKQNNRSSRNLTKIEDGT